MTIRKIITQDINPPITLDDGSGQLYSAGEPIGYTSGGLNNISNQITTLTATQILNLKGTPVEVVPAFGDGFMTVPLTATMQYIPTTVDYTLNGATQLFIGNPTNPLTTDILQPASTALLDGTNGPGSVVAVMPATNAGLSNKSWFNNSNLVLTQNGSVELTNGDGILVVKVYYVLIAV